MSDLKQEIATYKRNLPELLGQQGKFVLVKGDEVAGTFDSYQDALTAGLPALQSELVSGQADHCSRARGLYLSRLESLVPSINLTYTATGPIIADVRVAPSQPRQQILKDEGAELPQPTSGIFLVDTGASVTVIDPTLLAPLGLATTGTVPCHTSSTAGAPVECKQYDVMLIIPGPSADSPAWIIPAIPVLESHLTSQGIHGLIGRDVLDKAIFVYNGPINLFSLAY